MIKFSVVIDDKFLRKLKTNAEDLTFSELCDCRTEVKREILYRLNRERK